MAVAEPAENTFLSGLTGSFSAPAGGNPTGVMMEAAYRDLGLDLRYINCEVPPDHLGDAVRGARAMGWVGFNCSLPHKVAVIEHLDGLTPAAQLIGAVNCVIRDGDSFIGENTDGKGFVDSLTPHIDVAGASLLLIGAGGAARAIGVESARAGVSRIVVANRSEPRGVDLAQHLEAATEARGSFLPMHTGMTVPDGIDVVVNATSVGMAPATEETILLDLDSLAPHMTVCDVIPNPPQTRFLERAAQRGCRTIDGLGMLVNQGARAVEYWTGVRPHTNVMRGALAAALGV